MAAQGFQDAVGGSGEAVGVEGAFVEEGLAPVGEGVVDLGAAVGELFGERGVGVGEAGFELFDAQQQAAELFVAGLGGVGGGQGGGGGLGEQGRLGGELGGGFAGAQLAPAPGEGGAGPVGLGEDVGEPVEDAGAGRGVCRVEAGDQFADDPDGLALLGDLLGERFAVGAGGEGLGGGRERGGLVEQVGERVGPGEEGDGAAGGLGDAVGEVGGEAVDVGGVGAAQFAQCLHLSLGAAEFGEPGDPAGGGVRAFAAGEAQQGRDLVCGPVDGRGGGCGEAGGRLVFGEGLPGGVADRPEWFVQVAEAGFAEPVVAVGGAGAGGEDGGVAGGGVGGRRGQAGQGEAVGEAADEVRVADPCQGAAAGGLCGLVPLAGERCPPQLGGVELCRSVVVAAQGDQCAVVEQCESPAGERGGGLLADGVVGQQQGAAVGRVAEDEQDVLAVG